MNWVVLEKILNYIIDLKVIEQNAITTHQFVRKVTINANGLPIFKSRVKFDFTVSPESIMDELLKKKLGVGTIVSR